MGGKPSKYDESFRQNQWQDAHEIQIPHQYEGQYQVVRNRITGQLLDKYSLQFANQKQYNKYLQSISYRHNEPNVVRVVHYEPKVIKQFCGSSYMLNVYLEHCRSRLSQYEDIPFPDYLYCSMAMLDGYKKLYNKIGRFHVSQRQVMIDENGEIRVWINEDFANNQAQNLRYEDALDYNQQQYEMVNDIMRLIIESSDNSEGPNIKLVDFYQRQKNNLNHRVGFQEAKNIVLDYSRRNQIQIPDIFKSVYNIYQGVQQQRNHESMSFKNDLFHLDSPENGTHSNYQPVTSIYHQNNPPSSLHRVGASQNQNNQINLSRNPMELVGNMNKLPPLNNINNKYSGPIIQNINQAQVVPINVQHPHLPYNNQRSLISIPPAQQYPLVNRAVFSNVGPIGGALPLNISPRQINSNHQHPVRIQNKPFNFVAASQSTPIRINNSVVPIPNLSVNNQKIVPQQYFGNVSRPALNGVTIGQNSAIPQPQNHPNIQAFPITRNLIKNVQGSDNKVKVQSNPKVNENVIQDYKYKQQEDQQDQNYQEQYDEKVDLDNNNEVQFNQANIIKDLSELHRIQQEEKSKKSQNQNLSSNRNIKVEVQKSYENQNKQQQNQYWVNNLEEQGNSQPIGIGLKNIQSVQQQDNQLNNIQQENVQTYKKEKNVAQNTGFQPPRPPVRHQISQPQFYSSKNNLVNQFNSVQFNQHHLMQANIIGNQINQMQRMNNNSESQMSKKQQRNNNINSKRQFYYTLANQIELDPQIAADLTIYS